MRKVIASSLTTNFPRALLSILSTSKLTQLINHPLPLNQACVFNTAPHPYTVGVMEVLQGIASKGSAVYCAKKTHYIKTIL